MWVERGWVGSKGRLNVERNIEGVKGRSGDGRRKEAERIKRKKNWRQR